MAEALAELDAAVQGVAEEGGLERLQNARRTANHFLDGSRYGVVLDHCMEAKDVLSPSGLDNSHYKELNS